MMSPHWIQDYQFESFKKWTGLLPSLLGNTIAFPGNSFEVLHRHCKPLVKFRFLVIRTSVHPQMAVCSRIHRDPHRFLVVHGDRCDGVDHHLPLLERTLVRPGIIQRQATFIVSSLYFSSTSRFLRQTFISLWDSSLHQSMKVLSIIPTDFAVSLKCESMS